jgi:hypothetical protein
MCGQCPRSARAKKRCDHAHSRPTLYHGVPRIFLTAPLSYAAVAFHLGPCEKLLRYVKLATSCLGGTVEAISQNPPDPIAGLLVDRRALEHLIRLGQGYRTGLLGIAQMPDHATTDNGR